MMPSREITVPSEDTSQQPCRRQTGKNRKKAEGRWKNTKTSRMEQKKRYMKNRAN